MFHGLNLSGRHGTNDLSFIPLIFHDGNTKGYRAALQDFSGHRQKYRIVTPSDNYFMIMVRTFLLAETDRQIAENYPA